MLPVPVYDTIEKPAVVFALTELLVAPSELETAVPPAFQFHATEFVELLFRLSFDVLPTIKEVFVDVGGADYVIENMEGLKSE